MEYYFYGWERADAAPVTDEYPGINSPRDLYDALSDIWCEYTCAPRLRDGWSRENKTLGQCSITAFLVQDIFGGKVYGIPREGGTFHCYNAVGESVFDLTSEQFKDEELDYTDNPEQFREVHFAKEEKKQRYDYLCRELKTYSVKAKAVLNSRENNREDNTDGKENMEKFKCPCCGYYTLPNTGEYDICPVCFWEDDVVQEDDPDLEGGANDLSLRECRENYRKFGACEERFKERVRKPYPDEIR